MFDMLKAILFDVLGFKPGPLPGAVAAHSSTGSVPHVAVDPFVSVPAGYPVYDATGMVSVTDDHFRVL